MAENTDFHSLNPQISKDVHGTDNSMPLSPQWLLPKPGENKAANATADNHVGQYQGHADIKRPSLNGDEAHETHKKKDIFRPTVFEAGSGRRDRWRDEERDTNTHGRRDRWRETDKELGDSRKDRWGDNTPNAKQHYGEARRNHPERWTDSANKETNYEHRRESRWNTSWGPGDKDTDTSIEKWSDSSKETPMSMDKGFSHLNHHVDDKKDGDNNQPWRSSSVHGRGRMEPSNQGSNFSYGRGRGDNSFPTFSHGRGRGGSTGTSVNSSTLGRSELKEEDPSLVRYSRTNLLDIYRMTDMKSRPKLLDGGVPIASLTQEEPLGPLALCTPTSDELTILNGIGNGDIVSSGEPQISKDGASGRNSTDPVQARQVKFGSREDLTLHSDDNKGDMLDSSNASKEVDARYKTNEVVVSGDSYGRGVSNRPIAMWRSPSIAERSNSVLIDRVEKPTDIRSQVQKDPGNQWPRGSADSSHSREQSKWQVNDGSNLRRQTSFVLDTEEARRLTQTSPEDLILHYKDPQGEIQGPFSGSDIIGWFEAGYFGIDLLVRPANAPPNSPFLLLGDAMPHLRAKARPPPGFTAPKPNEATDTQGSLNLSGYEKLHASSSAIDIMKNEQRYRHNTTGEAENRFLESLMSGNPSASPHEKFAFPEGIQGINFERQNSLPNSYPYRPPGRDASFLPHNTDLNPDTINPHTKPLSSITDSSRSQTLSQNLLSTLQGLPDHAPPTFNSGVSGWGNLPVQAGLDHAQNFPSQTPFGYQQQRLQPQNQPSLTNLLAPNIDIPSALLNAENLLSSGLTQDQQMLNLLLLQLHSQSAVAPQQISLLDKLMLLKQQQKQEKQQQLLRQHQQLLSQILSDRRDYQHYTEQQPYRELQSSVPSEGNAPIDHLRFQNLQMGSHIPVTNMEVQPPTGSAVSQNINHGVGSGSSIHLPHQIFEKTIAEKNWDSVLPNNIQEKNAADVVNNLSYELPAQNISSIHEPANAAISDEKSGGGLKCVSDSNDGAVKEWVAPPPVVASEDSLVMKGQQADFFVNELKTAQAQKTNEKKSRKQKSSKAQSSSDQTVGISKVTLQQSRSLDHGVVSSISDDNHAQGTPGEVCDRSESTVKAIDPLSENLEVKGEPILFESDVPTTQQQSLTRAWRHAPGFRPKSLLEIQEEEQRKAQMAIETMDSSASSSAATSHGSTPWAGILATSDVKSDGISMDLPETGIPENQKGRKSQLHDLLSGGDKKAPQNNTSRPTIVIQSDLVDDCEFIEAKDTKKNRKKSAKTKNGAKASVPVASADVSIVDRTKTTRQTELEKEVLPAVPAGPSLGDFVLWKGGESASTTVAPAWSTDTGKVSKRTSLRDILKEQEKKASSVHHQIPIPTPHKTLPTPASLGNNPSWSVSATSSAKAASPVPTVSRSPVKTKLKGDDDLFWGPLDQPKQETKNMDFPVLASQESFGMKKVPGKGVPVVGSLRRQKSSSKQPSDNRLSSSPSLIPSLKGKTDTMSKHSEAMGFRDWCERECTRLLGSKDTSFLEFCLKQSRTEAKMFLVENLGAFDPDHEFIDRFIDYMELLPADVIEIAFQSQNNRKNSAAGGGGFSGVEMKSGNGATIVDSGNGGNAAIVGGGSGGGGKKKGKKGKKVSASVLGFNVVSNRIMMGEIQSVEE